MIAFLTLNHAGLVFLQQLAIWHLRLVDPFGVLQCAGKDTAWLGLGVLTDLRSPIGWHQEATDWCII